MKKIKIRLKLPDTVQIIEFHEPVGKSANTIYPTYIHIYNNAVIENHQPPPHRHYAVKCDCLEKLFDELGTEMNAENMPLRIADMSKSIDEFCDKQIKACEGGCELTEMEVLGGYFSSSIEIKYFFNDPPVGDKAENEIIKIHERYHAIHHLLCDDDKNIWSEYAIQSPSILELLAQLCTYAYLIRSGDKTLLKAFEELNKNQGVIYKTWRLFKDLDLDGALKLYWHIRNNTSIGHDIRKIFARIDVIANSMPIHADCTGTIIIEKINATECKKRNHISISRNNQGYFPKRRNEFKIIDSISGVVYPVHLEESYRIPGLSGFLKSHPEITRDTKLRITIKEQDEIYEISISDELDQAVRQDLDVETYIEGGSFPILLNRSERNPELRTAAIRIHGATCMACGFNFESKYGKHGKNFIEVHHINPVSHNSRRKPVNPKTEMLVVCSNCHRMIHRNKQITLSLDDLKKLMK